MDIKTTSESDSTKTIKWGFLSCGNICNDFALALRKYYDSYQQLCEDPHINIIYIGTPNSFHLGHAIMCLKNGKAVLCEKTLTLNASQARQVACIARDHNLFIMEGMWSNFFPSFQKMKEILSTGLIGQVKLVQCDFGINAAGFVQAVSSLEKGGGSLLSVGVYCINLACAVFDYARPTNISAIGHLNKDGVDDHVSIILKYGTEAMAMICSSMLVNIENDALIVGTRGTIRLHGPLWHTCQKLSLTLDDQKTPTQLFHFPLPPLKGDFKYPNSSGLAYQATHVNECLRQGRVQSDIMPIDRSIVILEVLDQIRKQISLVFSAD